MRAISPTLLSEFGGLADELDEGAGWDEIILSPAHLFRMQAQTVLTTTGLQFGGVAVSAHQYVPENIGILKKDGKVIGIMDFSAKAITFLARAKHGRAKLDS